MVVNNDLEVTQILEVNLKHANLEVISARNGAQALQKAFKEKPNIIILDAILPDLESFELCRRLKESEQTNNIPIIVMGTEDESEDRTACAINGADHLITKPFNPSEVVSLVKTYFRQIERSKNTNPLTGLPNQAQVNKELSTLLEQNGNFTALYVDIDNLGAWNEVNGFAQGDRAIQLLGETIQEAVALYGNEDDLAGHLGSDDFVVVTTASKARILCQRIISDFDSRIKALYNQKDLMRDYIEYEGRLDQAEQCPIMTLSIAVINNERRTFNHYLQVSEAAAQLMEYIKRFPGSNYGDNRSDNIIETQTGLIQKEIPQINREEQKILQRLSGYISLLTVGLEDAIAEVKEYLNSPVMLQVQNPALRQQNNLESTREKVKQLLYMMEELANMADSGWTKDEVGLEEVDLKDIFEWITEQVEGLAKQRGVEINIEGAEVVGRLRVDRRNLTRGLFYLLRGEIESSTRGNRLQLRVSDAMGAFVTIEIINHSQYIPPQELAVLFQDEFVGISNSRKKNDFYFAKMLLQCLEGKLSVKSEKFEGTSFTISVPRMWRSLVGEVNVLLSLAETSRKEARAQLHSIHQLLSLTMGQMPSAVEESLENLNNKIQELLVLCNRSLFLADDLNSQMENQQERLLKQEIEQLGILEAFVIASNEIATSLQVGHLFDLNSARRVAKNTLAMVAEFKLTRDERQALHHAALLKDMALVSSPREMVEQMVVPTIEEAMNIKERFSPVWKELSRLDFLSQSLILLLHRYDSIGHPSEVEGVNIPVSASILALADTFDSLTSGMSPRETLEPEEAVQRMVADSGQRFDSNAINIFLKAWRKKELQLAPSKSVEKTTNDERH